MVEKYKKPSNKNYTIYTISNCKYCDMAKEHIKKSGSKCININCDKYMNTCREGDNFNNFIKQYTIIQYLYFPKIFKNGKFVGGLKELLQNKSSRI